MIKIEITGSTYSEVIGFLKSLNLESSTGFHKCSCKRIEGTVNRVEPNICVKTGTTKMPKPCSGSEGKKETTKMKKRSVCRGGNQKTNEEFDRLCKQMSLSLSPAGKNASKKICKRCGTPFYGYTSSRLCPDCKGHNTGKVTQTPSTDVEKVTPVKTAASVQTPNKETANPSTKMFTRCVRCNVAFKAPRTDATCESCRIEHDRNAARLQRSLNDQVAAERERKLQAELESRTEWKICPACGTAFIPKNGSFYCNRCTEKALNHKRLQ